MNVLKRAPTTLLGVVISFGLSILIYCIYSVVWHEQETAFYAFAGLMLLAAPCLGGLAASSRARAAKRKTFLSASGGGLIVSALLLMIIYVIVPVVAPYSGTAIPASCIENAARLQSSLPADRDYAIPGAGTGTLIASDAQVAVVVKSDKSQPSFPSSAFLIDRASGQVLLSMSFGNDIISAALDDGILYLFNDKLGYLIDERTGRFANNLIKTDNYRGLYSSGDTQYLQTSGEFSVIHADGTVSLHRQMTFSGVAFGCFIS